MAWLDAALWVVAVLLFVGGDWLTTRRGLSTAGVRERNPVARAAIETLGFDAGLLALKAVALLAGLASYYYALGTSWPFPEVFPIIFVVAGLAATLFNLRVLAVARRRG
jgi:hypothetical protein